LNVEYIRLPNSINVWTEREFGSLAERKFDNLAMRKENNSNGRFPISSLANSLQEIRALYRKGVHYGNDSC